MIRKNKKFIDPRYFMNEKMEPLDEIITTAAAMARADAVRNPTGSEEGVSYSNQITVDGWVDEILEEWALDEDEDVAPALRDEEGFSIIPDIGSDATNVDDFINQVVVVLNAAGAKAGDFASELGNTWKTEYADKRRNELT